MLLIDRYNLSDAFYHKISLNVLENLDLSKLKRGISYLGRTHRLAILSFAPIYKKKLTTKIPCTK